VGEGNIIYEFRGGGGGGAVVGRLFGFFWGENLRVLKALWGGFEGWLGGWRGRGG
jgi:hypothetical protein